MPATTTPPVIPSEFDPKAHLLPQIVDHYALTIPTAIYAEYPVSLTTYDAGYRPITFSSLANAVNGIAWWLIGKLGHGNGSEILAYVGPNDLRYPALVLGAVKAGYVMFLTSPRNSVAAHKSLLEKLGCTRLVSPVPRPPPVAAILEAQPLDVFEVPSVDELLSKEYPHFEFEKTYPEAKKEPIAVIHTSGSTGIPKPIFWTHDAVCKHMHVTALDPPKGCESRDRWLVGKRMFIVPPPFHAAGLAYSLFISIPIHTTLIFPTSTGLPTASALVAARKQTRIDILLGVPSIIDELAHSPDLLAYCSRTMERLIYCGGDLPQRTGDTVAAQIPLMNMYGASEVGMVSTISAVATRDPLRDWRYLHVNPAMGVEMRHVAGGEYELVLVRDAALEQHQFCFAVFPDKREYATKDLFVRHPDPERRELWRWSARADDVVVFLNGEKTNPVSMEQHVASANGEVAAVLVVGARRFQAALLVELRDSKRGDGEEGGELGASERAAMIEKLWPSIEEANAVCPAHARIAKTHILFTKRDKPMLRAGKGTIQRAGSLALYEEEIDALYADADRLSQNHSDGKYDKLTYEQLSDPEALKECIRQTMLDITAWGEEKLISNTDNFFHLGLDSLQAITATRRFRHCLSMQDFSPNLIYLHPSVGELSDAVIRLRSNQQASTEATRTARLQQRDALLHKYTAQIAKSVSRTTAAQRASTGHTVILTGSTGNLGTYILNALLKDPSVSHIHCLNRRSDAEEAYHKKAASSSLTTLASSRATFWKADLSQPSLGLPPTAYETLRKTTTLIIHNAWPVNFNLSLASFEPSLAGVTNLLNLANTAPIPAHLLFISSISSTMNHSTSTGLIPETPITTPSLGPNAYADSKYIAEHLLTHAAAQDPSPPRRFSFARVGQVAGPVLGPGIWNETEWFPSLVLSSLHLGVLPDGLGKTMGRVDWMPVDLLAGVLVELALREGGDHEGDEVVDVFHPVNTHPISWDEIRPVLVDALCTISGKEIGTVPYGEWIQRVRRDIEGVGSISTTSSKDTGDALQTALARNPAAKLLDFFEGIMSETESGSVLNTVNTAGLSERLRAVDGVKAEWIEKWVREWLA
ncbi:hypothetical protein BJX64DRAFT_50149 [Aspergillus heterothallicus]